MGRSMLAGFSPIFGRHFALSGAPLTQDIYLEISDELRSVTDSKEGSPAVYIVANTNDWTVKVMSTDGLGYNLKDCELSCPAQAVASMVENTKILMDLDNASEFCLMHMEDCLSEIYSKSLAMAEMIGNWKSMEIDTAKVCRLIGSDVSDWPLLRAVACVHSPEIMSYLTCRKQQENVTKTMVVECGGNLRTQGHAQHAQA